MTKSLYADRDTVGTIALNAQKVNERVEAGDMAREMMPQLVDDINAAIASNPFDDRPFFITVHEKKDLLLTNMIKRRVVVSDFRPYPEPATMVFWTNPKSYETKFCWSLPHTSEFQVYFNNPSRYSAEQLKDILAYNMERMDHFGFSKVRKNEEGVNIYVPTPNFQDRKLKEGKLVI
jgi:hypothetical protein